MLAPEPAGGGGGGFGGPSSRSALWVGVALAGAVALALWLRLDQLQVPGIGSAEHWKLDAVDQWRRGNLVVDGEHPMLFKLVVLVATSLVGDDAFGLRLPNALLGGIAPLLVFLIARRAYGTLAGVCAAVLAATTTVGLGIDRTGKEDTLMVVLALGTVWCWMASAERPRLGYVALALAGACVAAKYEALFFVPALLVAARLGWAPRLHLAGRRPVAWGLAAFAGTFLVANALILVPEQQRFIFDFIANQLNGQPPPDNSVVFGKEGFHAGGRFHTVKPVWYYVTYLATKQQLVWVGLVAIGVLVAAWRRRPADRFLLLWGFGPLLVISLVPFGFARYLTPILPALNILGGVAAAAAIGWLWRWRGRTGRAAAALVGLVVVVGMLQPAISARVYPTLYANAAGGGAPRALYWGADDAGGDFGVNRAADYIAQVDPSAKVIVNDPNLLTYLLGRAGGTGTGVGINQLGAEPADWRDVGADFAVLQRSMVASSNIAVDGSLRRAGQLTFRFCAAGHDLVDVYDLRAPALRRPADSVIYEPSPAACAVADLVLAPGVDDPRAMPPSGVRPGP